MILAEVTDFELWQRAVRQQFQQGESVGTLLLGIGVLVGIVVFILVAARVQARWRGREERAQEETHPQRLYNHLLCSLGFTAAQQRLLGAVAKLSTLEHPTAMLVSEILFDRSVVQWEQAGKGAADEARIEDRKVIALARNRLFPDGRGIVQSVPSTQRPSHRR